MQLFMRFYKKFVNLVFGKITPLNEYYKPQNDLVGP